MARQSAPGVATGPERGEARSSPDGELSPELRYSGDDAPVVPRVSYEKDRPLRAEVALFRAESAFGRLDVVKAGLGFDDRIEISSVR
jgi:hypothetical protein